MTEILFIYQCEFYSSQRELIAKNFCRVMALTIELPDKIEIEVIDADLSVYGETLLDHRFKNRIRINAALGPQDLIHALAHELIHVHQIHTGKLAVMRDGSYVWNGSRIVCDTKTMKYSDYIQLPWEAEVAKLLPTVLAEALKKG